MASSSLAEQPGGTTRPRSGTAGTAGINAGGGIIGDLVRRASVAVMDSSPQLGMWQAAGTAIAQAPSVAELRGTETGGADYIGFNSQGHSARVVEEDPDHDGELVLVRSSTLPARRRSGLGIGEFGQTPALVRRGTGTALADLDEESSHGGSLADPAQPGSTSGVVPPDSSHGSEDKQKPQHKHHLHLHHHGHGFRGGLKRRQTLKEKHRHERLESWGPTVRNGLLAFWKFFTTPAGFCITIYCLNIVGWGAMLFFLLLNAAPAMAVPTADDDNSPRKIWLEIDSQILNALFCVTGLGLAPWRFRDLYLFVRATRFHDADAMRRLARQNKGWFRPPLWATGTADAKNDKESAAYGGSGGSGARAQYTNVPGGDQDHDQDIELGTSSGGRHSADDHHHDNDSTAADFEPRPFARATTFTGQSAPPTALWKLLFTIVMMVANTGFQCVLCYYMWGFNRFDRPTWATGTFIALGCGTGMFSGLMSWWEGRKVKKIEGPEVQIVGKEQI
ncbi:DUF2985 domain-containing protein [Microdochium nivale]|nr:DUF2985 domain-containing protein [Microdochium nivale]